LEKRETIFCTRNTKKKKKNPSAKKPDVGRGQGGKKKSKNKAKGGKVVEGPTVVPYTLRNVEKRRKEKRTQVG